MQKLIIEFEKESSIATVKLKDKDNVKVKYLQIDEVVEIIKESKNNIVIERDTEKLKDVLYDTKLLPSFNGTSVIQIIEYHQGNKMIVLKKEKCRHDFAYHSTIMKNVGLPTLLFFIELNKNNIIYCCKVFAVKDKSINLETQLYKYPFTNVYDSGQICFGANKDKLIIEDLRELSHFPDKFLMMPTTHDLRFESIFDISMRKFLEILEDMDFEDGFLIKSSYKYKNII